jgi:hypothetical protein
MSTDLTRPGLERPATRADLARQLLARVERLPALLGTVPLATEIQLLKRDLSRGHDVLRPAGETSYLSVICLVEAALASLTWKQYTPVVIDALREAFTTGTRQEPFTFNDYDAIRRMFGERGISVVPTIDLDTLSPEELDDGRED